MPHVGVPCVSYTCTTTPSPHQLSHSIACASHAPKAHSVPLCNRPPKPAPTTCSPSTVPQLLSAVFEALVHESVLDDAEVCGATILALRNLLVTIDLQPPEEGGRWGANGRTHLMPCGTAWRPASLGD